MRLLALDPGVQKTGLSLVESDASQGVLIQHEVCRTASLKEELAERVEVAGIDQIVLGDGTTHQGWLELLSGLGVSFELIDESYSTEEGRRRYFDFYPPVWWKRWIPVTLLTPPVACDDFAALILAERYLKKHFGPSWRGVVQED